MSKKILDLARDQQEEIAKEAGKRWVEEDEDDDESQGEPCVLHLKVDCRAFADRCQIETA